MRMHHSEGQSHGEQRTQPPFSKRDAKRSLPSLSLPRHNPPAARCQCAARRACPLLPLTASPMRRTRSRRTPRVAWASPLRVWKGAKAAGVSLPLPLVVCDYVAYQVRPRKRTGATSVAHRRHYKRADRGTRPRDASECGAGRSQRGACAHPLLVRRSRRRLAFTHGRKSAGLWRTVGIPTVGSGSET